MLYLLLTCFADIAVLEIFRNSTTVRLVTWWSAAADLVCVCVCLFVVDEK
jgi:hypothetical protein